jgi:hypothetical protein
MWLLFGFDWGLLGKKFARYTFFGSSVSLGFLIHPFLQFIPFKLKLGFLNLLLFIERRHTEATVASSVHCFVHFSLAAACAQELSKPPRLRSMTVYTTCPLPSPWPTYIVGTPTHALYSGIHSFLSIASSPFLLLKMSSYLPHIVALVAIFTFVSAQSTFPATPLASKTFAYPTGIVSPSYALGIKSESVNRISRTKLTQISGL